MVDKQVREYRNFYYRRKKEIGYVFYAYLVRCDDELEAYLPNTRLLPL